MITRGRSRRSAIRPRRADERGLHGGNSGAYRSFARSGALGTPGRAVDHGPRLRDAGPVLGRLVRRLDAETVVPVARQSTLPQRGTLGTDALVLGRRALRGVGPPRQQL